MKVAPATQRLVARSLLYDVKFEADMAQLRTYVATMTRSIDERATANTADMQRLLDGMAIALIGSTGLCICVSVGMVTFLMSQVLNLRASSMSKDEILIEVANQRKFSVAILLALFSMVVAFGVANHPYRLLRGVPLGSLAFVRP